MAGTGGSLKSIQGARKKKAVLEARVGELEKLIERLVKHYDGKIDALRTSVKELTRANNASSLVVATFEQWLDENHPGWDNGKREAMKEKAVFLAERSALIQGLQKIKDPAEAGRVGERIFTIARQIGTELTDIPVAVSAFVKARDADRALELIRFAKATGVEIAPEYQALFRELEEKVASSAAEKPPELEVVDGDLSESDEDGAGEDPASESDASA